MVHWLGGEALSGNEALQGRCPWKGQLEELVWLRERGCSWDANTCAVAAMGGHVEVLGWARVSGCPWGVRACPLSLPPSAARRWRIDVSTCARAAHGGHLEAHRWAQENGSWWDAGACERTAKRGHRGCSSGQVRMVARGLSVLAFWQREGDTWCSDRWKSEGKWGRKKNMRHPTKGLQQKKAPL